MKVVYAFKRLKALGFFELAFYSPSDISSDHIVINSMVVMRQGRVALHFRPLEPHLKYLRLITVHFEGRNSF